MTLIDQLKQFDEMRGKDPINPQVIQEGPDQDIPMIDPRAVNPPVPAEWLDDPEDNEYIPLTPTQMQPPPSPLIPASVRRSPDAPGSIQTAQPIAPEPIPDLLVISRNGVCVGVWKGKETELPDESRKAIARIVLKQIQKGISEELEAVIEKRGPRRKNTVTLKVDLGPIGPGEAAPKKRGRPRKVQA